MSCERVREDLLDGDWGQAHLRECADCRRFADALAAADRALGREPQPSRAPAAVLPAVRVAVERERARRAQRRLMAGASVSAAIAMVAGAAALPVLAGGTAGLGELVGGNASGLAGLVGELGAGLSTQPAVAILYALAGAALVRLLAVEV